MLKATWDIVKCVTVVAAIAVSGLAAGVPPAAAGERLRVTVADQPGAPAEMLRQLERLARQPLGGPQVVFAVETGGRQLTGDQIGALLGGREVDGVRVLGAMAGTPELLNTTIADLSDGSFDGPRDVGSSTSTVMFATSVPGGREWCLTMCMASGKTFRECLLERFGSIDWFGVDLSGSTPLSGIPAVIGRAGGLSLGELTSAQTLVGEVEPSEADIRSLVEGRDVDSLRPVANVERPDGSWALGDVAERSGVVYARTKAHIFTFELPWLGKILAVCISQDGGKTWKCSWKQWSGF